MEDRAKQKTKDELRKEAFILLKIAPKEFQTVLSGNSFRIFLSIKLLCGFKKQGYTFLFSIGLGTYPMLAKLLLSIGNKPFPWIGYKDGVSAFAMLPNLKNNNKVVLVPMDDAW